MLPVSTTYDSRGRPVSIVQGARTYALAYDAQSSAYTPADLEQSYSPPSLGFPGTTQTTYNLDQQPVLVSRPDGDAVSPTYDSAGRLASVTTTAGTTSYAYSTSGQLSQVIAPDLGTLSYSYDGALLTDTTWSGTVSGTVHRTFDSQFRLASESVLGGLPVTYQYDADGLLTAAGALQIQRDPASGFQTGATLGGITESRTYDAYGAEATYTSSFAGSNLYSVTYSRDALGRISSKTERVGAEPAHTLSYVYDLAGHLTDVSKDGTPTAHYAYDANNNRTAGPGLTTPPVYDAQDRLLSYGACSYTYKPSGELQTKTCPNGTTTYAYDAFGNLRHVTLPGGTRLDYIVDGLNRRIGKKVNGALAEGLLYRNQLQPAAWLNGDGSLRAIFVYGISGNVPEYMVQGSTSYRLLADPVGSVRLVINVSTGAVAERLDYDEFGNVLSDTAPGTIPFGFAGGLRDTNTDLMRFGARDYAPSTGRWTTKDPIRFGAAEANLYAYAKGDPVRWTDPSGLDVEMYCEWITGHGVGSLGRHCYLRAYQPFSPGYDVTVEIYGPSDNDPDYPICVNKGRPKEQFNNPARNDKATKREVRNQEPGSEDCVLNAFRQQASNLPAYNATGPNSNTFVRDILSSCGLTADFPWNAIGAGE